MFVTINNDKNNAKIILMSNYSTSGCGDSDSKSVPFFSTSFYTWINSNSSFYHLLIVIDVTIDTLLQPSTSSYSSDVHFY